MVPLYDFDSRPDFQVTARPLEGKTTEPARRTLDALLSGSQAEPWCTWQATFVGINPPAGRFGKASLLGVCTGDELVSVRGVVAGAISGADLQQLLQSCANTDSSAGCLAVFRRSAAAAAAASSSLAAADVLPTVDQSVQAVQTTLDCIVKRRTKRSHDGTLIVAVIVEDTGQQHSANDHNAGAERVVVTVDGLADQQELVRIAVYALIRREYVLAKGLTTGADSSADSDTEAEADAAELAPGAFSAHVNNAVKGASFQAHLQELLAKQLHQRTAELLSQQRYVIVPAECVREEVAEPVQQQLDQPDDADSDTDADERAGSSNRQHSDTDHNDQHGTDADMQIDDSSEQQHSRADAAAADDDVDDDTQSQQHSSSSSSSKQHSAAAGEQDTELTDEQPADSDTEQQQPVLQRTEQPVRSDAEHEEQRAAADQHAPEQHIDSDAETEQQGGTDTEQGAAAAGNRTDLSDGEHDDDAAADELPQKLYVLPESECLVLWLYRYRVDGLAGRGTLRSIAKAAVMPMRAWFDTHVQKVVVQGVPKNAAGSPLERIREVAVKEFDEFVADKPFVRRSPLAYDLLDRDCAQKGVTVEDTISAGEFSEHANRALRRLLPASYFSGWEFKVRELKPKRPRTAKSLLKLQEQPRKPSKEVTNAAAAAAARPARRAATRARQAAEKQAAAEAQKAAAAARRAAAAVVKKQQRAAQGAQQRAEQQQRPCSDCDRRVQRFCYLCGLCLLQHCTCTAGSAAAVAAAATAAAASARSGKAAKVGADGAAAALPLPPSAHYTASSERSVLRRLSRWHDVTTRGEHVSGSSSSGCDAPQPPPAQGLLQWIHLAAATQTEFEPSMCGAMAPSALVAVGVIVEELLAEMLRPIVRQPLEQQRSASSSSSSSSSSAVMLAERGYKRFKSGAELEREVAVQARFPSGLVMPPAQPSLQCVMQKLRAVYGSSISSSSSGRAAAAEGALSEAAVQAALQQCVLRPPLLLPLHSDSSAESSGVECDSAADEALQHVPLTECQIRVKRKRSARAQYGTPAEQAAIAAANAQWGPGYAQSAIAFSGLQSSADSESGAGDAHQADTSAAAAAARAQSFDDSDGDYDADAAAAASDDAMDDADTAAQRWQWR
jgi:hypothetical protein